MKESVEIKSYLDWSDKGRSGFLFYVIGLILGFFFFVFGGAAVLPLSFINPDYQKSLPLNVLGTLLALVLPFFAIPLIVKILHNRPSWSVAMPRFYFARWDFFTGFWVSMVISLAFSWLLSITGVMPVETNPDFDIKQFVVVALIGFVGIFIQAGAEEMLFRGYLTQFARRFTSNKYIFIGLPALLFALPHIINISDHSLHRECMPRVPSRSLLDLSVTHSEAFCGCEQELRRSEIRSCPRQPCFSEGNGLFSRCRTMIRFAWKQRCKEFEIHGASVESRKPVMVSNLEGPRCVTVQDIVPGER